MGRELFTTAKSSQSAQDAVAALITTGDGRYLMQLRDMLPHIWFPGHWGCFGGAVDPGESPEDALRRELAEELSLRDFTPTLFTQFDYDLQPIDFRKFIGCILRSS
ncbi:NUDIX domain-containing protein [Rhodospirillaceae bacterium KN72]|uniref:NUDIX domain-containing protein n=1 Tax=Pacificispira spongiicola TaxID=2729598 RepID=A0A7Y0HIM5_9PROT|nr:NUDIX domain-containing protein [Pacificispira spongiicola]NMM46719.1 NUDIX domain-containing protein [Pacificispira spongiicola]